MSDDLRQPRDFNYAERVERDAQADRDYLARLERNARHSPAPEQGWLARGDRGSFALYPPPANCRWVWSHGEDGPKLEALS